MATNEEILRRMGYDTNNLIADMKKKGAAVEKAMQERSRKDQEAKRAQKSERRR